MILLKKILNAMNESTRILCSIFLLSSVLVIFYQVFTRYILGFSLAWTEEYARYANVWMTFLGIGLITRTREHIRLDFFDYVLGWKGRYGILVLDTLSSIIFYGVLGYEGAKMLSVTHRQIAPGLQISLTYVYVAIPIGCAVVVVFAIEHLLRKASTYKKGE
jgi:TRAP-type C4-dicarboxylate transport system permease small subunit